MYDFDFLDFLAVKLVIFSKSSAMRLYCYVSYSGMIWKMIPITIMITLISQYHGMLNFL